MLSLIRKFRYTPLILSLILLSGCALKEIDNMDRRARSDADTAHRIMESTPDARQPGVRWTDKPLVNLNPVTPVISVQDDKKLPPCNIVLNRPEGLSLPELGQRITALCGLRVSVTPDAMQVISSTGGVTTQQITGTLPAPDDNGRVPLQTIPGQLGTQQNAQQDSVQASAGTMITGLKWNGELRGLLDLAASRLGLSWRIDQGSVIFYRFDTRTYQLVIINTKINSSASIDSGSGHQMGSSGASSSSSGDSTSTQKTAYDLSSNLYEDIRKTVESILTPKTGRYWLSSASGTLTATDTPEVLNSIGRYIDYENKVLNRQVQLNIQILSVTQTHNEQLGLDWGLVYKSLQNYGVSLNGSFSNAASNAVTSGYSILDTATGNAAKFSGSQLLIKALSEQGNVSVVNNFSRATTNLTPVPYQLSNQRGLLTSSSSTATANVGVTSSMTTTTLTTGLFMTAVPFIEANGDVQLQFAFSYDSPPLIDSFYSKDGNTRNDTADYTTQAITQKVNMKSGQTLMMTGADQTSVTANKQGTLSPGNFIAGGGRDGSDKRTTLIILVTPILMG